MFFADLATANKLHFSALCWLVDPIRLWRRKKYPQRIHRICYSTETSLEQGGNMQKLIILSNLLYCCLDWIVCYVNVWEAVTFFFFFFLAVSTMPFATSVLSPDEIPEDHERDTSNRE